MFFAKSLVPESKFFDEYNNLYDVQKEAIDNLFNRIIPEYSFENSFKGKIILPTGTGKTKIAEFISAKLINNVYETERRTSIFAIACHRLMLANNLMSRILYSLKHNFGICKFKIVVVNSGSYTKFASTEFSDEASAKKTWEMYGLKNEDIVSAKSFGCNLIKAVENWNKNDYNVLFVVLYQSMSTILNSGIHFDFLFCDESHISSERRYMNYIGKFVDMSDFTIHFTATPTSNDDPEGAMNNIEIYGNDIINKKPIDVVLKKLITPIEVVLLELFDKNDNPKVCSGLGNSFNHNNILDSIISGYKSLERKTEKNQRNAGVPDDKIKKPVLFVSLSGGASMDEFKDLNSELGSRFLQFRKNESIDLYMTKSADKFNGVIDYPENDGLEFTNLKKEDFLEKLDMIEYERSNHGAIIINIDQLSEGIDLPAIDGVMLFRNLADNPAKLLQIIGRSVRRANEDRPLVKDDTVHYDDWNKFVKPLSYVYLPISTYDDATKKDVCNILINLYNNYGAIIFRMWEKEDMEGNTEKVIPNDDNFEKHKNEKELNKRYDFKYKVKETIMNILNGYSSEMTDDEILTKIAVMVGRADYEGRTEELQLLMNNFANKNASYQNIYSYLLTHGFNETNV